MRSEGRSYLGRAAVPERGATVRCIAPSAHPCLATAKLRKAGGGVADGGRGKGGRTGGAREESSTKRTRFTVPGSEPPREGRRVVARDAVGMFSQSTGEEDHL